MILFITYLTVGVIIQPLEVDSAIGATSFAAQGVSLHYVIFICTFDILCDA